MSIAIRAFPPEPPATSAEAFAVDGLPDWLPRVALAPSVSVEVFRVAAASVGGGCAANGCHALLARMDDAGYLSAEGTNVQRTLRPEARAAFLARLEADGSEPGVVRRELLAAGLRLAVPSLAGQLAEWAQEARDWSGLESLWLAHSPALLMRDERVRRAFAAVPVEQRVVRPSLGYAAALVGAYLVEEDMVDLDQMTIALIREGRTLHANWAQRPAGDAAVVAGTLWMLAEATMPATVAWSDGPGSTYDAIATTIRDAARSGSVVSGWALTFYHATAALMAVPRADWPAARRNAELALLLTENCAFPGFLAALSMSSAAAASGNTQYGELVQRFIARHLEHGCRVAAWLEPGFHLVRAEHCARRLDRASAEAHLRQHEARRVISPWIDFQPMHARVRSVVGVLWGEAEATLAQFDSIVADSGYALDLTRPWSGLLLRSRAELLLAMGAPNRARRIVDTLRTQADEPESIVLAALLPLFTGDLEEATAKADDGIYALALSQADRAHLYAIRAAALVLSGEADPASVAHAAVAACMVCGQADTLVPFAVLPPAARARLLADHADHHDDPECHLTKALRRGAFNDLPAAEAATEELVRLTPREKVLLPLLIGPATAREIADQLYVSVNTVRKQVVALRTKLGASSRSELVRRAKELGLL